MTSSTPSNTQKDPCPKCGGVLFYLMRGKKGQCVPCRKAYARKWNKDNPELVAAGKTRRGKQVHLAADHKRRFYGVDLEEYLDLQGGLCLICCTPMSPGLDTCVDHDHRCCPGTKSCGKCVRGLLCRRYNSGLGLFRDDLLLTRSATSYLEREVV